MTLEDMTCREMKKVLHISVSRGCSWLFVLLLSRRACASNALLILSTEVLDS
jgi:hypothetical protein